MKVRVLKAYGEFPVGTIIPDMPGNVARSMIGRNMVEEIKEPGYQRGDIRSPMDRSMRASAEGGPVERRKQRQARDRLV